MIRVISILLYLVLRIRDLKNRNRTVKKVSIQLMQWSNYLFLSSTLLCSVSPGSSEEEGSEGSTDGESEEEGSESDEEDTSSEEGDALETLKKRFIKPKPQEEDEEVGRSVGSCDYHVMCHVML